jgi:hypothetical protein
MSKQLTLKDGTRAYIGDMFADFEKAYRIADIGEKYITIAPVAYQTKNSKWKRYRFDCSESIAPRYWVEQWKPYNGIARGATND